MQSSSASRSRYVTGDNSASLFELPLHICMYKPQVYIEAVLCISSCSLCSQAESSVSLAGMCQLKLSCKGVESV
jgi:hypothetical protein